MWHRENFSHEIKHQLGDFQIKRSCQIIGLDLNLRKVDRVRLQVLEK
jgi:hypothetical protein